MTETATECQMKRKWEDLVSKPKLESFEPEKLKCLIDEAFEIAENTPATFDPVTGKFTGGILPSRKHIVALLQLMSMAKEQQLVGEFWAKICPRERSRHVGEKNRRKKS